MKKILAVLLVVVTAISLCACGTGSKDKITLTMWCIATKSDSNRASYEAAIKDMEKQLILIQETEEPINIKKKDKKVEVVA